METRKKRYVLFSFFILLTGPLLTFPHANGKTMTPQKSAQKTSEKDGTLLITAFGDSLTAGLNVSPEQAYPALVEKELHRVGVLAKVVNAGVSGDTTSGGLRRLDTIIEGKPKIVILELGINDGLRGIPLDLIERNLDAIISHLVEKEIIVILAGMKLPPNYGPRYGEDFNSIFPKLAQKYRLPLIPFFLEGVAGRPELNQFDGIHPTGEGYKIVAETVVTSLLTILKKNSQN